MKTQITQLLGIEYPVFQGGMAWVAESSLASAVSNAGGLGIVGAMNSNADQLRAVIRKTKELTDRPFGVNIMLMSPFVEDVSLVVAEEKVAVVTTGAGDPRRFIGGWKDAGIKVIPVIPSVALAKRMEKSGADAVIAEGCESGGHIGELTTMTLVPQVCDSIDIPVIAAGGIADGRGMAASFMLGARGIQMGTRFLVAKECVIHRNYKEKVLSAKDIDTIATGRRLGHPVRALKNEFTRFLAQKEYDSSISNEEYESFGAGALRKAVIDGNLKEGTFMSGQIAGIVNKEQTCKEIITEVVSEAEALLGRDKLWL